MLHGVRSNSYLRGHRVFIGACVSHCSKSEELEKHCEHAGRRGGETSQATLAVLQNVPFPSKLKTKGNMASNWKHFQRMWSNYDIASRLVKQPKEERMATLLTCLGVDAFEIVDGLNFANDEENKDIMWSWKN